MYCITSASWGGAQLQVLQLCRNQIKLGNQVIFVVGNEGVLLDRVRKIKGVNTIILPALVREINPIMDIKAIYELHKLIQKEHPDILHLHSSKAGTIGRLSAIGTNAKTIFTVHGWAFTQNAGSKMKTKLYKTVEKIMTPFTDLFICVSEYDYTIGINSHVLNKHKKNAITIHNGVEKPPVVLEQKQNKVTKIVMTARFSSQKDQESLISAIANLYDRNFKMIFVGDGETLEDCRKQVQRLDISNKVQFVGFKSDVTPYLRDSDVYVLSTHYEGLPISIIEAMSYSLPILATDVGGNSELIDKNGILIDSNDAVDSLTMALKKMLNDSTLIETMGMASYSKFINDFQLKDKLVEINDAYERILS